MAKDKTCFIIMPISTPPSFISTYKDGSNHFQHVLDHLFIPALEKADFTPISPKSKGSDIIQAEIIQQLSSADLVLCDMSALNPNVFFEFGIRTALDKPVALVVDDKSNNLPFDTSIINYHLYESDLAPWNINEQIEVLSTHVSAAFDKSKGRNALWKYFGITETGEFNPAASTLEDKVDLLLQEVAHLKQQRPPSRSTLSTLEALQQWQAKEAEEKMKVSDTDVKEVLKRLDEIRIRNNRQGLF